MIYFIQCGNDGPIKIGKSNNPKNRLQALRGGCPYKLSIIKRLHGSSDYYVHELLKNHKLRGEWFEPNDEVLEFNQEVLDKALLIKPDQSGFIRSAGRQSKLQNYLTEADMSVKSLAKTVGVTRATIYHIINGQYGSKRVAAAIEVATLGAVSRMDILYPED